MKAANQLDGPLLVFTDGQFMPESSRIDADGLYVDVNHVSASDAPSVVMLKVQASTVQLSVVHVATGKAPLGDLSIELHVAAGVSLELREYWEGDVAEATSHTQHWVSFVEEGATLRWLSQHQLSKDFQLRTTGVHNVKGGMDYHVTTLGQGCVDATLLVKLQAEQATCRVHGLLLGQGKGQSTQQWRIEHLATNASSDMHYRALMGDTAKGSWVGHAHVSEHGAGAKVTQMSRQILLSKWARMHAKPELTIHCDEVACQHGATVGQLDEQALFYLQTRGIAGLQARVMLMWSFMQEVLTLWEGAESTAYEHTLQRHLATMLDGDAHEALADMWEGQEVQHGQ